MTEDAKKQIAVIAGLASPALGEAQSSDEASLSELAALVETAGGTVAARVLQNRSTPDVRTFLGEGKAQELKELISAHEAELLVLDNDISPAQTRALSELCDCAVLTRSGIILDIFAGRARTAEGKLQVELAQYKYLLPRLAGQGTAMSRLGGGIGTRGPGETKLETDRRHIRSRMRRLEEELEHLSAVREQQRRARLKNSVPVVALVGYTNAGKSTLMNRVTDAGIPANNRLFDTLDMTTRAFEAEPGLPALMTDTVGFIRRLPHTLISSFEATLSELKYAELLLHVIDCSDSEMTAQIAVTEALAADMAREDTPILRVYNKADLAPADLPRDPEGIYISAATGEGIPELLARIAELLKGSRRAVELHIPYSDGAALNLLYRDGRVESVEHGETGMTVRAVCDAKLYAAVRKYDARGGAQNG
ncbi:MAG: GTPase HflX [Clostridia bacterium]|nr:GTPase HflX [Clostridia bacterium]